jgi:hypothetical protein
MCSQLANESNNAIILAGGVVIVIMGMGLVYSIEFHYELCLSRLLHLCLCNLLQGTAPAFITVHTALPR